MEKSKENKSLHTCIIEVTHGAGSQNELGTSGQYILVSSDCQRPGDFHDCERELHP